MKEYVVRGRTFDGITWSVTTKANDIEQYIDNIKKTGLRLNEGNAFIRYLPQQIGSVIYSLLDNNY